MRIPAKMTTDSADRDRPDHRLLTGGYFLPQAVTISQLLLVFSHRATIQLQSMGSME